MREQTVSKVTELFAQGFVLIDLETTGLPSYGKVEMIEISILDHEGTVLLDTLVKPRWPIPSGASRVNNIYDTDVIDSPSFEQVYPELRQYLHEARAVAYNAPFEQQIIRTVVQRHQLPAIQSEWWCAMRGYATFQRQRRNTKLVNACQREGIPVHNAHRAVDDCRLTLALMRKIAAQDGEPGVRF
jgi:DNA polymerase III subunit epsilon